jgi:3-oxoadipate enol-lactonase
MPQAAMQCREEGKGTPLVLLHGFPFDGRMWDEQLHDLSREFRVIVPDLPGFGRSQPPRPFTVASVAAELRELLAGMGALPCILGGLSMGGYFALEFVTRFPADLKAILMICTRGEADSPEARENRNRSIQAVLAHGAKPVADAMEPKLLAPGTGPAVKAKIRQIMESISPQAIVHCLAALRDRADFSGRLGEITVPTLVVAGQYDAIAPLPVAQVLHDGIRGSELALISDAGHMAPMERPGEFNEAVRRFLRRIGRAS